MKFHPCAINIIPVKMVIDWKAQSTFYLQHIRVLLEIKVSTKPKPKMPGLGMIVSMMLNTRKMVRISRTIESLCTFQALGKNNGMQKGDQLPQYFPSRLK